MSHKSETIAVSAAMLAVLAYVGYFFSQDLPNSPYSRLEIWQLILGLSHPDLASSLASLPVWQLLIKLKQVEWLGVRLATIGYSAFIVASATAGGALLLRLLRIRPGAVSPLEFLVLSFGLGATLLGTATLALGWLGWLHRPLFWTLTIGLLAAATFPKSRRTAPNARPGSSKESRATGPQPKAWWSWKPDQPKRLVAIGLLSAPFLLIALLGAMLPATDFDVKEYHLQGPKEFFQSGRITFLDHNVYTNMPFGTEMLTLLSMVLVGDWWRGALVAQTVLAFFAPATAMGIYCLGLRLFDARAASFAALIYVSAPWTYRISIIPYTENALSFYLLASCLAVAVAITQLGCNPRAWWLPGLLAGAAASCKYTGLISTVLPIGVLALFFVCRAQRTSYFLFVIGGVAVSFGPWLAKNVAATGNPTYPLLYSTFGGRNWDGAKDSKWVWGHRVPLLAAIRIQEPPEGQWYDQSLDPQTAITVRHLGWNLHDVTVRSDWLSPLLFGLAPLAFAARKHWRSAVLAGLGILYLWLQWWLLTHRIDRFWVPMVPMVAILGGAGACWTQRRSWRVFRNILFAACLYFNFSFCTTALCGYNSYDLSLDTLHDPLDEAVNLLNQNTPATNRVLAVGSADLFHLDRPLVYNTVFNSNIWVSWTNQKTPEEVQAKLTAESISIVYVHWGEIMRYRAPGSYGFSEKVQPAQFRQLERAGVLRKISRSERTLEMSGNEIPAWEVYRVVDR